MRTMPTVENAATWFNAKTVDVVDRQTASIVDTRTAEGSNWSARATRKTAGFTQS